MINFLNKKTRKQENNKLIKQENKKLRNMATSQSKCDVCGFMGPKDTYYFEPRRDHHTGKLLNKPKGERHVIGHREKIIYIRNALGNFHHFGMCCCNECHILVHELSSGQSVFENRGKFYEYIDKRMKFRAMAKDMSSNKPVGIVLYTHYNRNFTKDLVVKVPDSDNASTRNNGFKLSNFRYVKVTNVYPKETIPSWAKEPGYSPDKLFKSHTGESFDYYVEVEPYNETTE